MRGADGRGKFGESGGSVAGVGATSHLKIEKPAENGDERHYTNAARDSQE
jgi:hypothetical protein